MKDLYAKMTFRLVFISFLALILIGCGESGTPGGNTGPGVTASINLSAGDNNLPADGVTSTTITAVLLDSVNTPVLERTPVVFRTTRGKFKNGLMEYKVQTPDDSGTVTVTLISDGSPGTAEVRAECNKITQKTEVKFYDPSKVGTITLRTGSASITADGASQVTVIATVIDALGNPEEGATVTFKTSLGQFVEANPLPGVINRTTTAPTDVDGEAAVMLVSGKTIGTAMILASINGLNTSATVIFTADVPKTITLRAAPSTIRPSGTSTLFAMLKDINGNPVQGETVNFSQTVNDSSGTLETLSAPTNVNGEAQATYIAGNDQGTDMLQAAWAGDRDMKAETTIVVDPSAIIINAINVTAGSPSLVADAVSKVKIRAIVTDIDGNPAIGKTVTFSTTAGSFNDSNLSTATATTNDIGLAEVMLKSTTIAGPVTVRAECDGFIGEVPVEFVPGPAHHILLYAFPDTVPPNGPFQTAAIVQDYYDNRIDDQRLMLQVRLASNNELVDTAEMTPDQAEDGVYRFDWTAATEYGQGNLEITARVNNGVFKTKTVTVDETSTIVGAITVTAGAEEIKADGSSSVLIRATVLDYNGNPASGITVDFATTLGKFNLASTTATATTNANGIADVMLRSGVDWGTATVTADANGFWDEVDVRFTSLKAGGVSLTAMPGIVRAGGQSTLIAELRDDNGSPVPNEVLYFDISENNTNATLEDISGTTDTNGRVTITYVAGVNTEDLCGGTCPCSGDQIRVTLASDSTISDRTCVEVVELPLGSIELTTTLNSLPADGTSTTNLRAVVTDANGDPAPGVQVTFTTTAGTIGTSIVDTDVNGIADTILTAATTAGTALVTANTPAGFSDTLEITFGSGAPGSVTVTPVPQNLTADGISTSTVTFEVRDSDNNPVSGATLVLSVDFGTLSNLSVVTINGVATATYTAPSSVPTGNIATITATATNGQFGEGTISLTGTLVAGITLSAYPETIPANGISQATVKAELTAVGGGIVPDGTEVTFAIVDGTVTSGSGTISPLISTTAAGEAITFLTSSTTPEIVTIQATAGGRIAEIDIEYTAGSVNLTIIPNSLLGTGQATAEVTATVLDVDDDPINGENVTITLDDLSLGSILAPNPTPTNADGEAVFTFQGAQKGGTVEVTATTASGLTATATIDIQPPPAFIEVADGFPDPTVINIRGTGGQSTSQIVFDVKDVFGNPVSDGYRVDLVILDGPNGGETIEPITAFTSGGQISTILRSGTRSGPVSIKATYFYNSSVFTVTGQITITSGPPVGEEFGIFAQYLNISGLWKANLLDEITSNVGDIYGNSVPDGTAISFKTYNTGGFFTPGSANTTEGLAINTLHSGGSYTAPQGFMMATSEANNGGRTTHITNIAVTPAPHDNILFVGTDGGGVYKSTNFGASWTNVSRSSELGKEAQNYIDPFVNCLCVDPDDYNTVYAATGYLGRGNIYRSIDGGITWLNGNFEDWYGLISTDNAILTLSCDNNGSDYVWAGTDGLGAIFAADGEDFQWGGLVTAGPTDPGAANTGDGDLTDIELSVTTRSETWTATYEQTGAIVSSPVFSGSQASGSIMSLSATETAITGTWTLTYSGDWSAVTDPVPANTGTGGLNINSIGKNTLSETWTVTCLDAATAGAEKWRVVGSISGLQATQATTDVPYTVSNKLSFDILSGGADFIVGDDFTFTTTADAWSVLGSGLPPQTGARTGVPYTSDNGEVSFIINGGTPFYRAGDEWEFDTTVIGNWEVVGSVSGTQVNRAENDISYTTDNGEVAFIINKGATAFEPGDDFTFTLQESGLGYGRIVRDIVREPGTHGNTAVLFAATASGVYTSTNGGLTWTVTDRFTGDNITCLVYHPTIADVLYAGTEDSGVWYTVDGGVTWQAVANDGMGGGLSASIPVATLTNTGNGIISNPTVTPNTLTETWTVECTTAALNGGTFTITGNVSGVIGTYNVATDAFTPASITTDYMDFTISDGSVDFVDNGPAPGDTFTFRTTRDLGTKIKDVAIDSGNDLVYAATYFNPPFEPFHAVGNVYSLEIGAADGAPASADWTEATLGLPSYDPPDDMTLFPQHALAFDEPTGPTAIYSGGEGINFSKATSGLPAGDPEWVTSKSGLTNLIMARMPILFTGPCTMNIANIEEDSGVYTYTVYVQDANGNPPVVGSVFLVELLDATGKVLATLFKTEYPDTYIYQGTWADPANPETNNPFIIRANPKSSEKVRLSFTPTCETAAPGCSGSNQEITYSY